MNSDRGTDGQTDGPQPIKYKIKKSNQKKRKNVAFRYFFFSFIVVFVLLVENLKMSCVSTDS